MKSMCTLRNILGLISILLMTSCGQRTAKIQQGSKPNILFILADDVGREVLGSYGGTSYETSKIDALADKGMRFNNVYSSPVCHPSRVTLLTGRYPFSMGNADWGSFPEMAEGQTFAHELKKAGYATAVAGKWQLATLGEDLDHPHRLGFDEYCLFGWHEGPRYHEPYIWQNGKLRTDIIESYGPDVYSDFLIDFMKRNQDGPFLAYFPMALIHDISNDLEEPPPFGPEGRYENVKEMVSQMNRVVGKMVQAITDLGIVNETIIIFTTDNGTNPNSIISFEAGEYIKEKVFSMIDGMSIPGGKKSFTDWGIRVPMMVVWPGKVEPGSVNNALIDFSDFLPTFLDLAGQPEADYKIHGRSYAGILTGDEHESRDWVFAQKDTHQFMIRTMDWKLDWKGNLYDMKNDPLETMPMSKENLLPEAADAWRELEDIHRALKAESMSINPK